MTDKQTLLKQIQEGLHSGVLTQTDLQRFMTHEPASDIAYDKVTPQNNFERLSAVDVMFYIAGFVFFSTIMSLIIQSWNDGDALLHILLSAGIGTFLWYIVYYLAKRPSQSDTLKGLNNALLLTGSLLLIVGGYVITNELVGGFGEVNFLPSALAFAVLGALHFGFDKLIRKDLVLLMGILLSVATFPAILFGILQDADAPMDVWSLTLIMSMALLVYATRVVAKYYPARTNIGNAFDSLSTIIVLITMYVASYGDLEVLWFIALIGSVLGLFYLSIITQNKRLLGNATFFLVLSVITISLKYFSDFGTTASLIVATCGLLGSAAVAASINKKYFK